MKYAIFWSGGKDSLLALDRARQRGLEITHLVNIFDGVSGRVRFHGVRRESIAAQAKALGIELVQKSAQPDRFEQAFHSTLEDLQGLGVEGIVFGNIHLADVRAWYEERTTAMRFQHVEPLWGDLPSDLIREFVECGHRARIVSINPALGRLEWLGRDFSQEMILELERASDTDVCGERGEYHSFAWGGPLFRNPLVLDLESQLETEGHIVLDFSVSAT